MYVTTAFCEIYAFTALPAIQDAIICFPMPGKPVKFIVLKHDSIRHAARTTRSAWDARRQRLACDEIFSSHGAVRRNITSCVYELWNTSPRSSGTY